MLSEVEPRPTVKPAFAHPSNVVRDEIVAKAVAFIYRRPELPRLRMNSDADRVPQTPRVYSPVRTVRIKLEDSSTVTLLGFSGLVLDIRLRSD